MSERFFSEEPINGATATLVDQEAHHLLHVMRLKSGDRVTLFDGSGAEFEAEVARCGRRDVELAVLARVEVDRERPAPLTIAAALPKGDRQRWMVEKLVELGVTRMVPLETERSVASLKVGGAAKLRRAVIEASKQCRRNRLMEITAPTTLSDLLRDTDPAQRRLFAHPASSPDKRVATNTIDLPATIAVGPEGGFSEMEVAAANDAGWASMDLGPRILRTETAAIVCAASAAP